MMTPMPPRRRVFSRKVENMRESEATMDVLDGVDSAPGSVPLATEGAARRKDVATSDMELESYLYIDVALKNGVVRNVPVYSLLGASKVFRDMLAVSPVRPTQVDFTKFEPGQANMFLDLCTIGTKSNLEHFYKVRERCYLAFPLIQHYEAEGIKQLCLSLINDGPTKETVFMFEESFGIDFDFALGKPLSNRPVLKFMVGYFSREFAMTGRRKDEAMSLFSRLRPSTAKAMMCWVLHARAVMPQVLTTDNIPKRKPLSRRLLPYTAKLFVVICFWLFGFVVGKTPFERRRRIVNTVFHRISAIGLDGFIRFLLVEPTRPIIDAIDPFFNAILDIISAILTKSLGHIQNQLGNE